MRREVNHVSQTFYVAGLHCQSCVRAITEALISLPAVSAVDVDLNAHGPSVVRVEAVEDVTVQQVQAALSEEGDYWVAP